MFQSQHGVELADRGFTIFREVLGSGEVQTLRDVCGQVYAKTKQTSVPASQFLSILELAVVPFRPLVVDCLKELLGSDYVTIPEFSMLTETFGGWHTDAGSQGYADYIYARNYLQVECGIYLQDNDDNCGGGLDVVPGSHKEPTHLGKPGSITRRLARRICNHLRRPVSVNTKAGDLIVWHFRLLHKATPQTGLRADRLKHGIFWGAAPMTHDVKKYMEHMSSRQEQFYADISSLTYPSSYPKEVLELVRRGNLQVASRLP